MFVGSRLHCNFDEAECVQSRHVRDVINETFPRGKAVRICKMTQTALSSGAENEQLLSDFCHALMNAPRVVNQIARRQPSFLTRLQLLAPCRMSGTDERPMLHNLPVAIWGEIFGFCECKDNVHTRMQCVSVQCFGAMRQTGMAKKVCVYLRSANFKLGHADAMRVKCYANLSELRVYGAGWGAMQTVSLHDNVLKTLRTLRLCGVGRVRIGQQRFRKLRVLGFRKLIPCDCKLWAYTAPLSTLEWHCLSVNDGDLSGLERLHAIVLRMRGVQLSEAQKATLRALLNVTLDTDWPKKLR